jgi:hypothetical protein
MVPPSHGSHMLSGDIAEGQRRPEGDARTRIIAAHDAPVDQRTIERKYYRIFKLPKVNFPVADALAGFVLARNFGREARACGQIGTD